MNDKPYGDFYGGCRGGTYRYYGMRNQQIEFKDRHYRTFPEKVTSEFLEHLKSDGWITDWRYHPKELLF